MREPNQHKTDLMHGITIKELCNFFGEQEQDKELWVVYRSTDEQDYIVPLNPCNISTHPTENRLYINADNKSMREFLKEYFVD